MNVEFKDNSKEILSAFARAKKNALTAIGITAERHAKKDPNMPVDTGRARNSITYATKGNEGTSFSYKDDHGKSFSDQRGTGADSSSVYIGSNVEYFPVIEMGGRNMSARHVLQQAAAGHSAEYKKLVKDAMKSID